jgi:hypothetical protein
MVSQGSFKSFTTAVSTSFNHGLRTMARVPAVPVKASLLEEVMVVEGNRLGQPYRSGCTLVHNPVLLRTSAAIASRHAHDLDLRCRESMRSLYLVWSRSDSGCSRKGTDAVSPGHPVPNWMCHLKHLWAEGPLLNSDIG